MAGYAFLARFSQDWRFFFDLGYLRLQAARALLRFCFFVQDFEGAAELEEQVEVLPARGGAGVRFPGPENVALAGGP